MRKPKYVPWADEFEWAAIICAPLGCVVERSDAQFELAKVRGDGVSLILYPHRTSAGHYHIRVRDNSSQDEAASRRIMDALNSGEGLPANLIDNVRNTTTFSRKTNMRSAQPGGE